MIEPIPPERVADVWPQARIQLARACKRGRTRSIHDVLCQLVTGNAQLWRLDRAWCVTEIVNYPRARVANGTLFAGAFDPAELPEILSAFRAWATAQHATALRIVGRPGWRKFLPDFHCEVELTCSLR